jgi:RNA polymerase sigma factor (sigma-70 family)
MNEELLATECYKLRPLVASLAARKGLRPWEIDDLMQEVVIYLVTYNRKYGVEHTESFGGLVRRSASQRALNIRRTKRLSRFIFTDSRFNGVDRSETPEDLISAEYARSDSLNSCADCTFNAELLINSLETGLTPKEIAEHSSESVNTIHGRIRRIRALLREANK